MHRIKCTYIVQYIEYNAYNTINRIKYIEYIAENKMHNIQCI